MIFGALSIPGQGLFNYDIDFLPLDTEYEAETVDALNKPGYSISLARCRDPSSKRGQ